MKTIKQLADEIGVTKQAVQKRMAREPLYTNMRPYISIKQGVKYIDEKGERLLWTAFSDRMHVHKKNGMSIDETDLSIDMGIDKDSLSIDTGIDKDSSSIDIKKMSIDEYSLSIDKDVGKNGMSIDKPDHVHTLIVMLQEQLNAKDTIIGEQQKSIRELTAALEHTTASLQAAQALHAGTMKTQFIADKNGAEVPEVVMPTEPERAVLPKNIFQRIFKRR